MAAYLKWESLDTASLTYSYHLLIKEDGDGGSTIQNITVTGVTHDTILGLVPGSSYTVEIFAEVRGVESLVPNRKNFCTGGWPGADCRFSV